VSLPNDDTMSLPVILAWLRVNWGKMVLVGVVCALLALPGALLKSKTYEATSTLLVFPPTFKEIGKPTPAPARDPNAPQGSISEMMPRTLPVEAYKVIALSPPLLAEVIQRVPLEQTGVMGLKGRLAVELVQMGSRSSQGITYTQTLLFHASASDPELAAKTAQAWAEVFKDHVDGLAAKGVGDTFALLDTLHNNTKAELERADLALAEHQKAWNLELLNAQLEAKQTQITEFEATLKQTEVDLAAGEMKVKALEKELADEPEKRVFFRAPSDDAYWIAGLDEGKSKSEPERGLRTEEVNPNYVDIRTAVVTARGETEGFRAKKDAILLKLGELEKEMAALTATLADKTVERDKLTRDSESLKAAYAVVRDEYEKGRMADRTQASDIVIAGKTVAPDSPSSPRSATLVLVAFFFGVFASGALLVMKDISEMAPARNGTNGRLSALPDGAPDEPLDKSESSSRDRGAKTPANPL